MTDRASDEPIDFAAVKAEHVADEWGDCRVCRFEFDDWQVGDFPMGSEPWPCPPYLLAVEAERLAGLLASEQEKVARVEALTNDDHEDWCECWGGEDECCDCRLSWVAAALADPPEQEVKP